ncbi:MAG: hypothetical protein WBG73_23620 [Coleofasciculaceae cyanobacterium]
MNKSTKGSLFSGRQSQSDNPTLSQKEIEMLRLAKRTGTSLEATAKVILLLRSRQKAVDSQAANG